MENGGIELSACVHPFLLPTHGWITQAPVEVTPPGYNTELSQEICLSLKLPFKSFYFIVHITCLCPCVGRSTCESRCPQRPEKAVDPLEMELQIVVDGPHGC